MKEQRVLLLGYFDKESGSVCADTLLSDWNEKMGVPEFIIHATFDLSPSGGEWDEVSNMKTKAIEINKERKDKIFHEIFQVYSKVGYEAVAHILKEEGISL